MGTCLAAAIPGERPRPRRPAGARLQVFYDEGVHGEISMGSFPEEVTEGLIGMPGEWLEFDPAREALVVRHIQPSSKPSLPVITAELVRVLAAIPPGLHEGIPGGDLFVHTEPGGELVRLRVQPGGSVMLQWAHPDFHKALKRPYAGSVETTIEPWSQRLNGHVGFRAPDPVAAAAELETLADTFEGLYPEGDWISEGDPETGEITVRMVDVNLDAKLLLDRLLGLAEPRSLSGRFEVASFGEDPPEQHVRFVFEDGKAWVQRPLLWEGR